MDAGGAADATVWQSAREHRCVLVTKDEAFHRLSVLRGAPLTITRATPWICAAGYQAASIATRWASEGCWRGGRRAGTILLAAISIDHSASSTHQRLSLGILSVQRRVYDPVSSHDGFRDADVSRRRLYGNEKDNAHTTDNL